MLLLYSSFFRPMGAMAQCSPATTQSITYTKIFTGSGNDPFTADFPKLDPSTCPGGCIFIAAVLKANLTVSATVTMETISTAPPANFTLSLLRDDDVSSSLLGSDLDPATTYKFKNNNLAASDGVPGSGPDYLQIGPVTLSDHIPLINDSITGSGVPFEGSTGNNSFTYTSTTNVSGTSAITTNVVMHDTIAFSITYYYCPAVTLSANILTFTATRQDEQTVKLDWITANEQAGRNYNIEVSGDGATFRDFASVAADPLNSDASYTYNYPITSRETGKLYFRLKQVDANGMPGYSPIRIIDLGVGVGSGFSIYPNPPSDYLNLLFPKSSTGWQVDVLTADGGLIQRNYYHNTGSGRLNFQHLLAAGTYFVRATDQQSAKSHVASFVIHL